MNTEAIWTSSGNETSGADRNLFVRFHMGSSYDPVASKAAGHPKYKDVPYITIQVPGDKSVVIDREVRTEQDMEAGHQNDADTVKYAKAWEAFKAGRGDDISSGTPLREWAAVTRAQVDELAHFKIHTVEQLAGLTDANAQRFMGSIALRQKAKDWLAQAERAAPFAQLREEMEAKVSAKDTELATLREELVSLQKVVSERVEKAEPKRKAG